MRNQIKSRLIKRLTYFYEFAKGESRLDPSTSVQECSYWSGYAAGIERAKTAVLEEVAELEGTGGEL